ncbi:MAG: hypothetical protein HDT28_03270 [Clostridiales bacterium]|nr:hypothetical protein [Clostridiales bacterium]
MQTKYPILLVHGIVLKENKIFRAFGKIGKNLKAQGYCVHIGKHDGFGTIENNAAQLKAQILEILEKENAEKINLIAHSKGGLDCKYLIKELQMEDNVASLTTLCTPHKGSPIATKIMKLPKFILKFVAFWVNFWYRIFGDKHPDAYTVCDQLRQREDIDTSSFSDKVYCQSFSTTMKKAKDDFVMGIPLMFSGYFEKSESDGLVPVYSTVFENYRGNCTSDSVSHSQIVDFFVPKKKKELIYSFYYDICKELADMGF